MAKSKKNEDQANVKQPAQEGNIDPYSAGNHIPNPEPNNGADNKPAEMEPTFDSSGQEIPANDTPSVPNSDQEEQDEVAAGREEPGTVEEQLAEAGPDASENESTPEVETPEEDASEPTEEPVAPESSDSEKPAADL